jgi:hypothetical protein
MVVLAGLEVRGILYETLVQCVCVCVCVCVLKIACPGNRHIVEYQTRSLGSFILS